MFGCFINILKRASTAIFGGQEREVQELQHENKELLTTEAVHEHLPGLQLQISERQEQLRLYAEAFKESNEISGDSPNGIAIDHFLQKVQDCDDVEYMAAVDEALKKAQERIKESRQIWDRMYNQRFASMEMRQAISIAYLSLRLKLVTSISNAKLKSNAAVDKVMEQKSLLEIMSKVFWLRFSYFEKVDAMICDRIALRVNEALEDERCASVEEYNKYRKLVYGLFSEKIDVEELFAHIAFEKTDYHVQGINLDSAYVSVLSILGTIVSMLWKVLLVFLFILGVPLTTMMTIVANPTWLSYITEDRNPYVLAFSTFLTFFVVGLFIIMAVRLFVWNPAVVNSFQQKYRIIDGNLNIYIDGYWQPKLDALERQYEALNEKMEHYFKEERAKISGLNELQLSQQINEARLLAKFFKGIKLE